MGGKYPGGSRVSCQLEDQKIAARVLCSRTRQLLGHLPSAEMEKLFKYEKQTFEGAALIHKPDKLKYQKFERRERLFETLTFSTLSN